MIFNDINYIHCDAIWYGIAIYMGMTNITCLNVHIEETLQSSTLQRWHWLIAMHNQWEKQTQNNSVEKLPFPWGRPSFHDPVYSLPSLKWQVPARQYKQNRESILSLSLHIHELPNLSGQNKTGRSVGNRIYKNLQWVN